MAKISLKIGNISHWKIPNRNIWMTTGVAPGAPGPPGPPGPSHEAGAAQVQVRGAAEVFLGKKPDLVGKPWENQGKTHGNVQTSGGCPVDFASRPPESHVH